MSATIVLKPESPAFRRGEYVNNENKKISEFISDIAKIKKENIKNIDTEATFERFIDSINNEIYKIDSIIQINKEITKIKNQKDKQ